MRTTVTIDDELYNQALSLAEPNVEGSELFREALKTFVRLNAGKRLAALSGAQPEIQEIPRRKPE